MQTLSVPAHDEIGWGQRISEIACLAGAAVLIGFHLDRLLAERLEFSWPDVLAAGCGAIFADFMSGLIHWFADTWFEETMPILGRRLLRPFRVHHANPDDLLRRSFIDTNGDVSMVLIPILLSIHVFPLTSSFGHLCAVFLLSACIVAWPTNQIHQWAHMPRPPRAIGWLQSKGILLSGADHRRHHEAPYMEYYCIATGWLNRPLTAVHFFRRLERLVTRLTGLQPRQDDTRFIDTARKGREHV